MIEFLVLYVAIGLAVTVVADRMGVDGYKAEPLFLWFLGWPVALLGAAMIGLFAFTEYLLRGLIRGEWEWRLP